MVSKEAADKCVQDNILLFRPEKYWLPVLGLT